MYLGIDIGGTKTLLATFSDEGELLESLKFPTPKKYEDLLVEIKNNSQQLEHNDFKAVGVGSPGLVNRKDGVLITRGKPGWENLPVKADIEQIFHTPAIFENDAKLAGLSEAQLIKSTHPVALYITISTGIGCSVVRNGKLDPSFLDMEVGWAMIEHKGEFEKWEDFASGRAIVAQFGKLASEIDDKNTWKTIVRYWYAGLSSLFATIQPDALIIGGSVGTHFERYGDLLKEAVKKYETPLTPAPEIFQAQRSEQAVAYGCYHIAQQHHESTT